MCQQDAGGPGKGSCGWPYLSATLPISSSLVEPISKLLPAQAPKARDSIAYGAAIGVEHHLNLRTEGPQQETPPPDPIFRRGGGMFQEVEKLSRSFVI